MTKRVATTFFTTIKAFIDNKKTGGHGDGLRRVYNAHLRAGTCSVTRLFIERHLSLALQL